MSDRRHPDHTRSTQERTEQTQRLRQPYPSYTDPAYSGQSSYPPPYYGSPPDPNSTHPTDKLPQYWQQGQPPPDQSPQKPEPGRPRAPRWLWIAAVVAVVLVTALVIALVIANGTARRQTAVPALPQTPSSQHPAPTASPSPSASAPEPATTAPSQPANAGAMQTVVYNVSGDGRAISITYVDNDGMMQTEFNVGLPWTKEVSLPESGSKTPNVTIVNIGHDVTCTVTIDGVEINQRSGVGLTICNGSG
ncbi:MAG TPA: MmpS family transport accessory protein [Mycobacterium sp.]|uniref:MmpS family transport accessory protein n=1 Tax=Mycobacterium sp. TaxID=1785 RepID=UPI002F3F4D5F